MTNKQIIKEFRKILKGIDKNEIESADGWWTTSTGVKFGTIKLKELETFFLKFFSYQRQEFRKMVEDELKEIIEGKGAYSQDQLTHAENTIKDMKRLAADILRKVIEDL